MKARGSVVLFLCAFFLTSCQWLDVRKATITRENKAEVLERARKSGKLTDDELRQLETVTNDPMRAPYFSSAKGITVADALRMQQASEMLDNAIKKAKAAARAKRETQAAELRKSIRATLVRLDASSMGLSQVEVIYENVSDRPIERFSGDFLLLFEGDLKPTDPDGKPLEEFRLGVDEPAQRGSDANMMSLIPGYKTVDRDPFKGLRPGAKQKVVRVFDTMTYDFSKPRWPGGSYNATTLERRGVKVSWQPSAIDFAAAKR